MIHFRFDGVHKDRHDMMLAFLDSLLYKATVDAWKQDTEASKPYCKQIFISKMKSAYEDSWSEPMYMNVDCFR